ncbi:MAG: LCP family protein [Candidatus Saccharibacteria bacterium]
MKKQRSSIDGFIPRRSGDKLGDMHRGGVKSASTNLPENKPLHTKGDINTRHLGKQYANKSIGRSDIDESLRDIDDSEEPKKKLSRKQRRRIKKMSNKPHNRIRKFIKWFFITILVVALAIGGYTAYRFIAAGNNIFQGNIFDIFQSQPLKQDSNGRSNFLILGTSEDDPGHGGADLTDSMLVVSIDQKNKNIYMFSVPRDLYVEYGIGCVSGYAGKINAYFACSNDRDSTEAEQDRLSKTQKLVGDIFGLDIQYGVHVNHTVIKEAVDAVGGIDVDIQGSNGAPGVLDRNFDWRCNYTCYLVKYNNGINHLDGEHALYLSMARGDIAPTYGLANSNFDREKNQQKILVSLKNKAMTTGTLTNLDTVTKLIDSFGNNMRTNIKTNEIQTLMKVTSEVKSKDVHTLSLFGIDSSSVFTTGGYAGQSVVMPTAGIFDYSDIQTFIKKNLSSDPIAREAAPIVILNATGQSGFGQTKGDTLKKEGYNIALIDNAPDGTYGEVEIYQIGSGNSGTATKLAKKYGVTIKKTAPPLVVDGNIRFVIIYGASTTN